MARRVFAAIQILIVIVIIGFGTYHLFRGNFAVSMATMPLLIAYYFIMLLYQKRSHDRDRHDEDSHK
jgi:hypothetical protein